MPPRRLDRATGVLLGAACGEAAVAGGEYGEVTRTAVRIARVAASGMDSRAARDEVARELAGRRSLAWTGIVALGGLCDPLAVAETVRAISELTDPDDPLVGDACVLWAAAVRAAVMDGSLAGPAAGLGLLPSTRRSQWTWWITQAERQPPMSFIRNGSIVPLLQAAWSAVVRTPVAEDRLAEGIFACGHLTLALEEAARAGDSVAATAGTLLGARWGASAVPFARFRTLRPRDEDGLRAGKLVRLGALVAGGGRDDARGWPSLARRSLYPNRLDPAVPHPCDPGVTLGGLGARETRAQAVVSLCQVGHADFEDIPVGDHLEPWLVDHPGDNNQPRFVIDQAARAVAALRAEGKRVFLHCHAGLSRTPAVAARYACLVAGMEPGTAFAAVEASTGRPAALINPELRAAVYELAGAAPPPPTDSRTWARSRR